MASVGDVREFKNGRQFSAWLGLVPRQHSTGGKQRLGHITGRGDPYLRTLLVMGARSVLQRASAKPIRSHAGRSPCECAVAITALASPWLQRTRASFGRCSTARGA